MAMQSTDPVADMLTRIRNGLQAGKTEIRLPSSKLKETIAQQLKKAGYLADVKREKGSPRDTLIITMVSEGAVSPINEIHRLSKPGRRVYVGASEIPQVKNGRGIVLVSTSKGVMTGAEARKARLGGELICKIY